MQGAEANSSVELASNNVAAPLEAAWDSIRTGLRRDLGTRTFDGWLKPAELGAFEPDSGTLDMVMPSQFMADWVRSHFGERLTLAWKTVLPVVRNLRIIAAADAPRPAPLLVLEEAPAPAERDPNAPNFDPRYRFETFIVGKANEVAATAARTLATSNSVSFNPLFIHSAAGLNKRGCQDREAPTLLDAARRAEKFLRLDQRFRLDTAGHDSAFAGLQIVVAA